MYIAPPRFVLRLLDNRLHFSFQQSTLFPLISCVFACMLKNVFSSIPNKITAIIDGSNLKSGLYFAQIKTLYGVKLIKLIKE